MKILTAKINTLALTGVIVLLNLFTTGCKKEDKTPAAARSGVVSGPFLYVGGAANNKGVYWKTSLSAAGAGTTADTLKTAKYISSLVTSGTDVYVAGQTGGYYKNDVFVPLAGGANIQYLALSASTVFATGTDNTGNIGYWQNNTETNLSNTIGPPLIASGSANELGVSGIAASRSSVYVSGSLFAQPYYQAPTPKGLFGNVATLWTNGTLKLFSAGGYASTLDYNSTAGTVVLGDDVYVAGRLTDSTYAGGFWKNGVFTAINNGSFVPSAIAAFGADLYITGYTFVRSNGNYTQQGAYWKNGTLVNFPSAVATTAAAVNGADLYLLGVDTNGNNVVWKNGAVFITLNAASAQSAVCMAIGN